MIDREMESRINEAIAKVLNENTEFSNVARPKPTRASTAATGTAAQTCCSGVSRASVRTAMRDVR